MCALCCEVGELLLCPLPGPWWAARSVFSISRPPPLPPRPTVASRAPVDRELEHGKATEARMK